MSKPIEVAELLEITKGFGFKLIGKKDFPREERFGWIDTPRVEYSFQKDDVTLRYSIVGNYCGSFWSKYYVKIGNKKERLFQRPTDALSAAMAQEIRYKTYRVIAKRFVRQNYKLGYSVEYMGACVYTSTRSSKNPDILPFVTQAFDEGVINPLADYLEEKFLGVAPA